MSNKFRFTSLLALFASISLIVACSSSTSSSGGSGQIPTGLYTGTFSGQTDIAPFSVRINGRLSISFDLNQTGDGDGDDGGDGGDGGGETGGGAGSISGNLAVTGQTPVSTGQRCFTGGTVTGTVNGNQMNLTITTLEEANLSMTGRVTDDSYSGTFSADNSNCSGLSGNFRFDRV